MNDAHRAGANRLQNSTNLAVLASRHFQFPRCGGQRPCAVPLRTLARWPRTFFPQVMSPTITASQRLMSNTKNGTPHDFDYHDVTIGKTLLDACRRRADHFGEEFLSSCLSSVSHDRKERPVVCSHGPQVSSAQETQRHNSENEEIRTLLEGVKTTPHKSIFTV